MIDEQEIKQEAIAERLSAKCPVCLDDPSGDAIYACEQYHVHCASCFKQMQGGTVAFPACSICKTLPLRTTASLMTKFRALVATYVWIFCIASSV